MSELFTYRKRIVTSQDVEFLIKLIADNPQKKPQCLVHHGMPEVELGSTKWRSQGRCLPRAYAQAAPGWAD